MESLVYKTDEVASMLKCSRSKAYNIINKMNKILIKEKNNNKNSVIAGRINKLEFDKIYK